MHVSLAFTLVALPILILSASAPATDASSRNPAAPSMRSLCDDTTKPGPIAVSADGKKILVANRVGNSAVLGLAGPGAILNKFRIGSPTIKVAASRDMSRFFFLTRSLGGIGLEEADGRGIVRSMSLGLGLVDALRVSTANSVAYVGYSFPNPRVSVIDLKKFREKTAISLDSGSSVHGIKFSRSAAFFIGRDRQAWAISLLYPYARKRIRYSPDDGGEDAVTELAPSADGSVVGMFVAEGKNYLFPDHGLLELVHPLHERPDNVIEIDGNLSDLAFSTDNRFLFALHQSTHLVSSPLHPSISRLETKSAPEIVVFDTYSARMAVHVELAASPLSMVVSSEAPVAFVLTAHRDTSGLAYEIVSINVRTAMVQRLMAWKENVPRGGKANSCS